MGANRSKFWMAGVALIILTLTTACGDGNEPTGTSTASASASPSPAATSGTPIVPSKQPASPTPTPSNTATVVTLKPETWLIPGVKRTAKTAGCDPKTTWVSPQLGGGKTYKEATSISVLDVALGVTIEVEGPAQALMAIVINGTDAAPITESQQYANPLTIQLFDKDWGVIKQVTVCAGAGM